MCEELYILYKKYSINQEDLSKANTYSISSEDDDDEDDFWEK